jgi:type II secretory pathway component PulK
MRRRRREAGYALMLALFVLFVLSISLALIGLSLAVRMRMVQAETEALMRGTLADAALDEALANLALSTDFTGAPRHRLGPGEILSRVEPLAEPLYAVAAEGIYAGRSRRIAAVASCSDGEVTLQSWRLLAVGDGSDP